MDYGLFPPEINSGRMYAGPGPGSLLASATAWGGLATELHSTAVAYHSVISALTSGPWLGPTSVALAAAAAPYVVWLLSSTAHAELAASQATAAAAAHEAAFAMHVPPPVIAANRALVMSLRATNFLGQNTPAIAATETHYGEMWAQDAAAMYGYAGACAAATELTDFEEPVEMTDPAGMAQQAAAVAGATGNSTQTGAQNGVADWMTSTVPSTLQTLAAPITSGSIDDLMAGYTKYIGPFVPAMTTGAQTTNALMAVTSFSKGLAPVAKAIESEARAMGSALSGGLGSGAGGVGGAVSAGLGRSLPLGMLSVPPSWAPVATATSPVAAAASTGASAAAPAAASSMHGLPMGPLGHMAGHAAGRTIPQYGFRPSVMSRPPAAG